MRVGILCEFSGIVRDAFLRRGHDAVSCDLLPDENDGGPHVQGDCLLHDWSGFDLLICHPPCTYLARSGGFLFKTRKPEQKAAIEFVKALLALPVPRIALENPIGVLSSQVRKPEQIIHPWQFGHATSKATCLWLKGLPKLRATLLVKPVKNSPERMAPPHPERWKMRSRTFPGIADAMADQWGRL